MELKGSQTEKNLRAAFEGESAARSKYSFYSSVAKKEGYEQIAAIFAETSDNEKEHAKLWFKLLGELGGTVENLLHAAEGEHYEWTTMYKNFAEVAKNEGFDKIASMFTEVGEIEEQHEIRYNKLRENVMTGIVFKRDMPVKWVCRNCGYVHDNPEAPDVCPACSHPKAYFEIKCENY